MPKLADLFRARYRADGADFDAIRLHHGGAGAYADLACRAVGARAFTVGTDIYFAAGEFRPGTRDGLWLLAHEVAHVLQQSSGLVRLRRPDSSRAYERAADAAADALLAGRSTAFGAAVSSCGIWTSPSLVGCDCVPLGTTFSGRGRQRVLLGAARDPNFPR